MAVFQLAPIERLMRQAAKKVGIERISEEAVKTMVELLESWLKDVTEKAKRIATHAGRATLKDEDIKLAAGELKAKLG